MTSPDTPSSQTPLPAKLTTPAEATAPTATAESTAETTTAEGTPTPTSTATAESTAAESPEAPTSPHPTNPQPTRPQPTRPQSARPRRLRNWMPDQHGAWFLVIVPPLLGAALSGFTPLHGPLLVAWWVGYFASWALARALKSPRRRDLRLPAALYSLIALAALAVTFFTGPYLLWWGWIYLPLIAVWLVAIWRRHERSLATRAATVTAGGLTLLVFFHAGLLWKDMTGPAEFSCLPPAPDLVASWLTVPPWIITATDIWHPASYSLGSWAVPAIMCFQLTAYFLGTIPVVKSLIRERGNPWILRLSWFYHCVLFFINLMLANLGLFSYALPLIWAVLAGRAIFFPLSARRRARPWRPRQIGLFEVGISFVLLGALFV